MHVLLFLAISALTKSEIPEKSKNLECYVTKKTVYAEKPKFQLESENTEIIEYRKDDELKTGPPICVMFYGSNETHSATWQGHVSSFALPLECHINSEFYTHCFHSPNNFPFLELPTGWACCCSAHKCNFRNPSFFQFFEKNVLDTSRILNQLKPLARYSFCIFIASIFMIFEAGLEVLAWKIWGKRKKNTVEGAEKDEQCEKVKNEKEQNGQSPANPLKSPLLPTSSLKVQATQSSPPSENSNKINSEMTIKAEPSLQVEPTQDDEVPSTKRSEFELANTQKGEDDDIVPIPEKPAFKVTKTGRIQKTSMNYEESTYSDLLDD
ncbi:hypothetical protein L3Y34_009947 [Caenorhabditis briggsae]|uniref:Uncharacterized protein n=1 Tax=Caenorhabditis briggsae TaxID=6238 RepID=A0AAE9ADB8_CAEBR|nr:hypothetical protein L3Y34_009947 [Caenorhabditis briggsae]